jgi:hypothetical protein
MMATARHQSASVLTRYAGRRRTPMPAGPGDTFLAAVHTPATLLLPIAIDPAGPLLLETTALSPPGPHDQNP